MLLPTVTYRPEVSVLQAQALFTHLEQLLVLTVREEQCAAAPSERVSPLLSDLQRIIYIALYHLELRQAVRAICELPFEVRRRKGSAVLTKHVHSDVNYGSDPFELLSL